MEKNFLIRVGEQFFAGFNKNWLPLCVALPSLARHYDYQQADRLCQTLRQANYDVYVCDSMGRPATIDVIQAQIVL